MADALVERELPGAIAFQAQGKFYPGEPNARWAVHLLWNRSRKPLPGSKAWQAHQKAARRWTWRTRARPSAKGLGLRNRWHRFEDRGASRGGILGAADGSRRQEMDHAPVAADRASN